MCPACLTTVALVAAATGSTGGLAAVAAHLLRRKRNVVQQTHPQGASK
jgi:hypothetical protein